MALDITTRRGWGARTGRIGRPMGRVSRLIIHHFWRPDVPADASRDYERSVMRGVEAYHAAKDWSAAPGYQWVVFDSGRVYEGVGWGRTGVHTAGYNSIAIAFCFGNDGDAAQPTAAAWQAAHELQGIAKTRGHLTAAYNLSGHTDHAPKSCPGNRTYPLISRVRSGRIPDIHDQEDDVARRGDEGTNVRKAQFSMWGGFVTFGFGRSLQQRAGMHGKKRGEWVDGIYGRDTVQAAKILQRRIIWPNQKGVDDGEWTGDDTARLHAVAVQRDLGPRMREAERLIGELGDDATLDDIQTELDRLVGAVGDVGDELAS